MNGGLSPSKVLKLDRSENHSFKVRIYRSKLE